jgi:hypothetical protein
MWANAIPDTRRLEKAPASLTTALLTINRVPS